MPTSKLQSPTLTMAPAPPAGELPRGETLILGDVLGEGGMGRVLAAEDLDLQRSVALKILRDPDPDGETSLLKEARVLAQLEHPNILPIYGVRKVKGALALVLKRVQGEPWSELMAEHDRAWNLEILLQIMDAVAFAHRRGFLHRDLKPSNVMVGEFGEVYLMDWGLALPLQEAKVVFATSGSLPYMAPEMLRPYECGLSERTDVYLLGAILYEIICQQPPHQGASRAEIMEAIARSQPPFAQHEDIELVAICQRSLRQQPEARFQSVAEFARAIRSYQGHAASRSLQLRAQSMAHRLEGILREPDPARCDVYEVFGPCRFAFQEALRSWPENDLARSGLRACTELVVEYELSSGEAATAVNLLAEIGVSDGEWIDRAEERLAADEQAERHAQELRVQSDKNVQRSSRRRSIICIGIAWTLVPLLLEWLGASHRLFALGSGAFLISWLVVGAMGRAWIEATLVNRQTYGLMLAGALVLFLASLGLARSGLSAQHAHVLLCLHFFAVAIAFVILVEWRVWPSALMLLVSYLLGMHAPRLCLLMLAASNATLAINAFFIGRPQGHTVEPA